MDLLLSSQLLVAALVLASVYALVAIGLNLVYGRQQKAEQPAYNWSALFQQQPAPETGSYFLDEWLRPYRVAPDRRTLHVYAASDFAVTAGGGDFTMSRFARPFASI